MTDERTGEVSQRIEWLTPDPVTGVQPVYESDDNSGWHVTPHWALVDGRAIMVGLDIRSFDEVHVPDGDGGYDYRRPLQPHGLVEVTQQVLRSISISAVRDESRLYVAERLAEHAQGMDAATSSTRLARSFADAAASLTVKGQPRRRRPTATEELLRRVADLYKEAVTLGIRARSRYVEEALRNEGVPVSTRGGRDQVRKWVQRARQRGLLPPAS